MNSEIQTGDSVVINCGELSGRLATVSVMESEEILHLRIQGQPKLRMFYRHEVDHLMGFDGELIYPLTLSAWHHLGSREREAVVHKLVNDYGDFKEDFDTYIAQPANLKLLFTFIDCAERTRKTHSNYGSKAIFEELRWHHAKAVDSSCEFKINNNYTADLARVTVRLFPELEEFFKLRRRVA
jgi:hypothetical protein